MVSTATVVVKATGATREVPTSAPIVLDAASTVRLQIDPDNVRTISRAGVEGRDLVIVLDDGTQIVVSNYFVADDAGTLSELVLEDATGAQWWLRDDPDTGGFMLVGSETIPVASALTASDGAAVVAAGEGGPSALAIGLGVGALALGAAAAGGGGGGGSGGTTPTPPAPPPPDTTPPARPTAQINATGSTVSGTAEPASNVRVYDAGGNVIGSARADGSGNYTITLNPPRVAGEQLTVTATDAAGNESAPIGLTAPDLTDNDAPDAPTAVINAAGDAVSGTAEAGATVNVYDADGNVIGTGVAGADGRYTIALDPPLVAGEALTVTATDAAGNESAPVSLNAPDLTDTIPPDAPTAVINAAGDTVSGSAEVGATVNVYDADGNVIGTGIVGTDGRYTIALDPPLIAGEALTVTATDAAGNESDPIALTAPDLTDVVPPDAPTAVINGTGDAVSGTAEVGATVNVYDADGNVIGTGVAGTDGRYTIGLDPALTAGEALTVTATDAAGNESAPIALTAPDLTDIIPPDAPTAVINGAGDAVSGTAEVGATVNVYDADGNVIGTGIAGTDGRYTIALDPALIAGEALTVTATDAAGNESAPIALTAPDLTDVIPPDAPTAVINGTGDAVSGTAEVGATVNVYDADGNVIGTGVAGTDGRYSIGLDPALTAGEVLTVTATDAAGNESAPIELTAPDLTDIIPPDAPTAVINGTGDAVSGTAEVGATVNVYDVDGNVIGTGIAGTDGRYTIALAPPLIAGEALTVTATDASGNESAPIALTAPDLTDITAPEPPTAAISAAGDAVTGTAEIGSTVNVYDADGNVIGTGVAGTNGRYTIALDPPLIAGEVLTVTASDAAGNESGPTSVTAPDLSDVDVPASPTAAVSAAGDSVSGNAEAGATVTVYDADGNVLGTIDAGLDGAYTIPLDPPLTAGEQLSVTATNAGGESYPTTIFAPDLTDTDAPDAPTAVINDGGDTVSGLAEAGATVEVRNAAGDLLGTGAAGTDGRYSITLDPPLTAGEQLLVTAIDGAGNVSDPTALTAPDLTDVDAPAAPSAVINDTGDTVSGLAEAGARVEVRSAAGDLLGSGTAGTDGRYTITLDPPLTAGEQLLVTAIDGAGNVSDPTALTAPDLTDVDAPAAPSAAINDTGDTVTGLAEAGATVEVRNAAGDLLGSGAAGTDGRYTIALDPPLTAGEQLLVTAIDGAGNISDPTALTAPDLTDVEAPAAPSAVINDTGDTVSGLAEAGARVEVRNTAGDLLGFGAAGTDGRYSITLDPPLTAGEQLLVTAIDGAGNISDPTAVTAPDLTDVDAPAAPSAAINDTGDTVSGLAEAGATVEVRNAAGDLLGSGAAGTDGRYTITLDPPLIAGEQLLVTAIDGAGNVSDPTALTAPDLTDVDAPPAPTAAINDAGDTVSGQAEAGSTVTVSVGDVVVGTAVAGTGGAYTIGLAPPLTAGEQLSVTATDAAGNVSDPTLITAPVIIDEEAPLPPTATISDDGATVSGNAEALSTVRVYAVGGGLLGTATADADGAYSISLTPPLIAGEALEVTATDAAGNESDPTALVAPVVPDTEAPPPPTASISGDGVTVSGTAEPDSTVRVYNAAGSELGMATATAAGAYSITLDPPLTAGEQLTVTATDAAGNESDETPLQAPDLSDNEAPLPPTASISAEGDVVSGTAEEGSTVTVRDLDNNVLGSIVAGPGGSYSITLTPPLTGGERLSVTATDLAGNVSDPTLLNAPNLSDDIIAYDDIVSANLDLQPATENVALGSVGYLALVSLSALNLQATVLGTANVSFSVEQGHSLDAVFDYSALLSLGVLGNYQVVVQRWDGTQWTGVGGTGQATLLELNLLTGVARAEAPDLGPGEYRAFMTFNGIGVGVLGALSVGGVESDFTVIADVDGTAVSGNVVTDGAGDVVTPTTAVQSVNGQAVEATATTVVGAYGVLTIDSTGAYTYVPNELAGNIGQVDQFTYTLFDSVTGNTSTATLYVRIDSADVNLTWDDAAPGAPATFDFAATGDNGTAGVEFANVTGDLYDASANLVLTLFNPVRTYSSQAFTVTDNMDVSGTASVNMLASVLSNGSLALQQQTTTGAWVNVAVVNYNLLLAVLGPVATIDLATLDLGAGTYRFRASVGGLVGVNANVNIDVNATYLDQFEVASVDNATGNLLANDVPGSSFTQLQVFNSATGTYVDVDGGATVTIQGQYGSLTVDAGGNYVYSPAENVGHFNQPVSETFEYRLLHPTGQFSDGELVVTVEPGGAGVLASADTFDLESLAAEDAQAVFDAEAGDGTSSDYDVSSLFETMGNEAPLFVRGAGDEVIALDAPRVSEFASAPMWEVEYGVPLRQEDDTDTLLLQHSTSAL
ncbi:Ig-like domain-containing protein [Luteimonas fraxinea]|uniref:Ig-like domain-containing protein n=1 Tax=Luteimonas fraxinea TaxID=2901869 RepID=A0ABS8UB87_9GAMM|nr:BapA/Bap/LapF family large adhesin [Luteimonas fraxinea]MCD9096125.1 Ig-like domain-containing protein [Luteimonas fraxinea]UHH10708.1 Ig-like domain-containing protein [Luteimonas fraxinea]